MKKAEADSSKTQLQTVELTTLGQYAHAVIGEQFQNLVKQEKKVLADKDPEHLHHMRVSSRRLRTALSVFRAAIQLPKAASAKRLRALAQVLGNLRDLDVQIADLQDHYRPQLTNSEQDSLDTAIAALRKQRRKAFAATEEALTRSQYQNLKSAYQDWLNHPRYTELAQLPLQLLVPDLLSPLLAELLLHPGWLVPATHSSGDNQTLHDLRKACKHVRYQAEFFQPFYGDDFQSWIEEIKTIQTNLGQVQDSQVLLALLAEHLPSQTPLPKLQAAIQHMQEQALSGWETTRHQYLDADFRDQLRHRVLEFRVCDQAQPSHLSSKTHPDPRAQLSQPQSNHKQQSETSFLSSSPSSQA